MTSKPKLLFLDIETSPYTIRSWGTYETDALEILKEVEVISFGVRWLKDPLGTQVFSQEVDTEASLLRQIAGYLEEADAIVAHNGEQFDMRIIKGRMLKYGIKPPKPLKVIDTLKVARKHFKLPSNKLDSLGAYLKVGRKLEHEGYGLWKKVLAGDKDAWKRMRRYNAKDVDLLYRVYMKLRPWMGEQHPALQVKGNCQICGAAGRYLQARGNYRTRTLTKRRLCCTKCGSWSSVTVPRRELV